MENVLAILQIIVSVSLVALILLQERSGGLSGLLGGEGAVFYQARRGLERMIFGGTIALTIIFAALAILNLLL